MHKFTQKPEYQFNVAIPFKIKFLLFFFKIYFQVIYQHQENNY